MRWRRFVSARITSVINLVALQRFVGPFAAVDRHLAALSLMNHQLSGITSKAMVKRVSCDLNGIV